MKAPSFVLVVALLALASFASAQSFEQGLAVGKPAPAFTLKNQDGQEVSLDSLLKKGKVALVFFRSADW